MEYLPLGSLKKQGDELPITFGETLQLLVQGLTGLEYLHSRGMTHRDLKPQNILVKSRHPLSIKLADFGCAKDWPDMWTFCGSKPWMAPEVYKGWYTSAIDIWSFGLVVFSYGCGLPNRPDPFGMKAWWRAITTKVEASLDDPLGSFLSRHMLQVDPRKRSSASKCLEEANKMYHAHLEGLRVGELYTRNDSFKCTTPTEEASTIRLESRQSGMTEPDQSLQRLRSGDDDRSRKRQKLDGGADGKESVSQVSVPVRRSLGRVSLNLSSRRRKEPGLAQALGSALRDPLTYVARDSSYNRPRLHQVQNRGTALPDTLAVGVSNQAAIAGQTFLPATMTPASAVRREHEEHNPTLTATRIVAADAEAGQLGLTDSEQDLYNVLAAEIELMNDERP